MTSRVKLTTNRISNLSCPPEKAQVFLWDLSVTGLGLRVTPKGKPSFVFQSRINNKTVRITIGSPSNWSISEAQKKARELQRVIDEGKDPRKLRLFHQQEEARKTAKLSSAQMTFGEVFNLYLQDRMSLWGERHYKDNEAMIAKSKKGTAGVLYPLCKVQIGSINSDMVEGVLSKEAVYRPARTRLALRHLRAFWNWVIEQQRFSDVVNPHVIRAKKTREIVGKPGIKNDHLEKEQLSPWFKACMECSNTVISSYLQCLLLTGARREELAQLQWKDVNLKWKVLKLRDKSDGYREIPLTPFVERLIVALPRRNIWVFSSKQSKSGKLVEPRIAHKRIAAELEIHLTLHGLRRSFKSLTEWLEIPVGVVAQIMGHKPSATAEKHYTIRPIDLLRTHHEKIEAWILSEANVLY